MALLERGGPEDLCYYLKELRTRSRIVGWVEGLRLMVLL